MERSEHAARINEEWQKGVDAVIETGMRIIDARNGLEHGEYIAMVENDLHFKRAMAFKLVAIASNKVLSNVSHGKHLPTAWTVLYDLSAVGNKGFDLEAGIESGAIHPKMERKDVKKLLQSDDPEETSDDRDDDDRDDDDRDDDDRDDDDRDDDDRDDDRDVTPTEEEATNPLTFAWEQASGEERTSFLLGLGREVLLEALAAMEAADKRTTVQRIADRAEARSAAAVEPKRRGRPPGSKSKPKTTEPAAEADDCSDTLAAQMRRGESAGAPEDPYEIPPMLDRAAGAP